MSLDVWDNFSGFDNDSVDTEGGFEERPVKTFTMMNNTYWNADRFLAEVIRDVLVQYKEKHTGYLSDMTEEGWNDELDFMIERFGLWVETEERMPRRGEEEELIKALNLFAGAFTALWD